MKIDLYIKKRKADCYSINFTADNIQYKDFIKNSEMYKEFLRKIVINNDLLLVESILKKNTNYNKFVETFIVSIARKATEFLGHGIHVHLPDNMLSPNALMIEADVDGTNILTHLVIDGIPLTQEEYEKLKKNPYTYVEINGKYVYSDYDVLKHQNKRRNIATFLIEIADIPEKRIFFKEKPYTSTFKFDNSNNVFKAHQVQAIEYIVESFGKNMGILMADDMGLGKTATAIGVISCIKSDKPSLVVVPKSVVGNWINEFKRFAPNVKCYPYKGSMIRNGCVYIATYGDVLCDPTVCGRSYATVVLDEAQQIKNHKTVASARLRIIDAENRMAMTGTPMENTLMDLWTIMDFVQPGLLGTYNNFKEVCKIEIPICRILSCIKPYCIRRMKSEIDSLDLPTKTEHIVSVDMRDCEKKLYNAVIDEYIAENNRDSSVTVLKYLSRLKMVCGNPQMIFNTDTEPSKLAYVKEIIRNSKFKPFVIFTQYRNTADMICNNLNKLYGKDGIIIDGTLSAKERTTISNRFQNGEYPFIVLTLKAGNCGLTLTNSCNLIHYDRWWNPAVENQATDRVYRIGQRNDVNIYKLVCKDTVEERIANILDSKTRLFNTVVDVIKENKDLLERKMD